MNILLTLYLFYQDPAVQPIVNLIIRWLLGPILDLLLKPIKDAARAWLLRKLRRVLYWRYLALWFHRLNAGLLA